MALPGRPGAPGAVFVLDRLLPVPIAKSRSGVLGKQLPFRGSAKTPGSIYRPRYRAEMPDDSRRNFRTARTVILVLGLALITLGIAAVCGLLFIVALSRGGQGWVNAGAAFAMFATGAVWTMLAGGFAVWLSRRMYSRTLWPAGLFCVALGAVPVVLAAAGVFST